MDILKRDLRPRDIVTREALLNSIAGVVATGGSTNAVLHLLALAREADVELHIDDFDEVSRRTPLLADMKPACRYTAPDLWEAGGTSLVGRYLREAGLLYENAITVTGKTLGEAVSEARETPGQQVVRPPTNPYKESGGLIILRGNLAPDGCVMKISG